THGAPDPQGVAWTSGCAGPQPPASRVLAGEWSAVDQSEEVDARTSALELGAQLDGEQRPERPADEGMGALGLDDLDRVGPLADQRVEIDRWGPGLKQAGDLRAPNADILGPIHVGVAGRAADPGREHEHDSI